jgi:hypothetical protein
MSARTAGQLKRMERHYSALTERLGELELRGEGRSYGEGIDSARRGVEPGRLTQQFSLSRTEADLLTILHGREPRGPFALRRYMPPRVYIRVGGILMRASQKLLRRINRVGLGASLH